MPMFLPAFRILYVEDDPDNQSLFEYICDQNNWIVKVESQGAAALETAAAEKFDLFLLDSWLPDISGSELCKRLRERDFITPILFYSGAAYPADRDAALAAGAQAYLIKPCRPETLIREIRNAGQWKLDNLLLQSSHLQNRSLLIKNNAGFRPHERSGLYELCLELSANTQAFRQRLACSRD